MIEGTASLLDGIRVVDFSHIFAGPLATQILGDFGADVIKVERIGGGDPSRAYGQSQGEPPMSGSFISLNRNKRSIALDLSRESGREIARSLIQGADVVVQNLRPGLMAEWGLDFETLSRDNAGLIYCTITGFGHAGKLASKAANDLIIQAYSGLMSFTGEPGGGPVRTGTAISDFTTGLYAAIGILGAIHHRTATGKGQEIHTSLLESQVSLLGYFLSDFWLKGVLPERMGSGNRLGIPNQAFPTRDGWVVLSTANDSMWVRCCRALGIPEVAVDPRFSSLPARYENTEALISTISEATKKMTTAESVSRLEREGVSSGPINTLDVVAADPQLTSLNAFVDVPRGDGGAARVVASPLHFSETPARVVSGVPTVGQHTEEILIDLGLNAGQIAKYREEGLIA